jgi:hypothetical protein
VRVEIRCCCDPGRLLGWVELPAEHIREGDVYTLSLRPDPFPIVSPKQVDVIATADLLELPVAFWYQRVESLEGTASRIGGLALKSNDTPIETLRRVRGFQEVL